MHIDHTTIRTRDIEKTRDFFVQVFGLTQGPRPDIIEKNIPGFWMYSDENPIVHIIGSAPRFRQHGDYSTEAIDHTAFFMKGHDEFRAKLEKLDIRYSQMELPDINEKRIFLQTPTGVLLETVFRNE